MQTAFVFLACLVLRATANDLGSVHTRPIFLWSNDEYFFKPNVHTLEAVSCNDVSRFTSTFVGRDQQETPSYSLSRYLNAEAVQKQQPKVVAIVRAPKMGNLPQILPLKMQESVSSLVIPHVFCDPDEHSFTSISEVTPVTNIQDPEWLEKHLFTRSRILEIQLHPLTLGPSIDELMANITASVEKASQGKFVLMFQEESSSNDLSRVYSTARHLLQINPDVADGKDIPGIPQGYYVKPLFKCPEYQFWDPNARQCFRYVHMTPNMMFGLMVGALLTFTALVGLCCLMGVQTPTIMDASAKGPPKGKEF